MYKLKVYYGIKDTDRIHHFHLNRTYDIIAAIIKKYTSAGNESINISLLMKDESNRSSGSVEYKLQRETDIITMGYQMQYQAMADTIL